MTTEEVKHERKINRMAFILGAVALALAVASSLTSVQNVFKSIVSKSDRQILAKITGYYGLDQTEYLILKIKDSAGLQIEIYTIDKETSQQTFKQKFELTQDTDAYITLDKNTTNLALSDVDKDGQLDILAPSVDRNGNLRLNSYRFNSELNSFEPMQESNTTF
ncbi:MAG: hypothetical protein ACXVAX_13720 [Pseudobdellovibrio sp.]